jgi:hypothetical protein
MINKEDVMGRVGSVHGGEAECIYDFDVKSMRKEATSKTQT